MFRHAILTGARSRAEELKRLVASCQAHLQYDWQLWIALVESASQVAIPEFKDKRVRIVREWPRVGVSAGLNRIAALARDTFNPQAYSWVNDDIEILPEFDTAAACVMEEEKTAIVASYYETHTEGECVEKFHVQDYPRRGMPYANFGTVRADRFWAVEGFDPRVKLYGMDNALCFRLLNGSADPNCPNRKWAGAVRPLASSRLKHYSEFDQARRENAGSREGWPTVWDEWEPHLERLHDVQQQHAQPYLLQLHGE